MEKGVVYKHEAGIIMDQQYVSIQDNSSEERNIQGFTKFLDRYYPLSDIITSTVNFNKISRFIWYCNHSGIFIPELQTLYDPRPIDTEIEEPLISKFYHGISRLTHRN